jgi:hypothetical protein
MKSTKRILNNMVLRIFIRFLFMIFNPNCQNSYLKVITFCHRVLCQYTQNEPDINIPQAAILQETHSLYFIYDFMLYRKLDMGP